MKVGKFLAAILLLSIGLSADPIVGDCIDSDLDVAYSYCGDNWIIGLSDGSCWKLASLKEKRERTWTEWFSNVEPKEWDLSDEFFFDPLNWKGQYTIEVHAAKDSITSGYNYILINQTSGEKAFAQFVPNGSNFIPRVEYAKQITDNAHSSSSKVLAPYPFLDDMLVLEDKSVWRLYLMGENRRSISDWWNGVDIDQPDEIFLSTIDEWKSSDEISVYLAHFNDEELQKKYRVSKPLREIFLIENKTRGKIAYAGSITFKDFLVAAHNHATTQVENAYADGYTEGYKKGYHEGSSNGHSEGYTDGYKNGYKEAQTEVKVSLTYQ